MAKHYKCVYCRKNFHSKQLTRDHVIAGSWYPKSTPSAVQPITARSCGECNNKYSADERYVLLRLSACVDPRRPASEGIWERARQAINVTSAHDERERAHRQAARNSFNQDTSEIGNLPEDGLLPSFARNFDIGSRTICLIDAEKLNSVIEKWGLGVHSFIWKEPVADNSEISVIHISESNAQEILRETDGHWKTIDKGPGIRIRYLVGSDGTERHTLYEFEIWGHFIVYVSIREHDSKVAVC